MHGNIELLLYWRNSLVDGYRLQELEFEVQINKDDLKKGEISPEKAADIKKEYKKAARAVNEKGKEATQQENIPVLVCPIKLVKKFNHYQESTAVGDKELIPLWIPAILSREKLQPREPYLPWIARNMLEPTTQKGVTIGDIEDIEKFLSNGVPDNLWDKWEKYWEYAHWMLKALPEGALDLPGYAVSEYSYVMPDVEIRGAAMNAIRTLDHVISTKIIPPLLSRYASLIDAPERPILKEIDRITAAKKHFGQMNGKFPLSISQREAIHHFLEIGEGEILAINGPPGTGKTTLMHSVVATEWVNAALKQSQPPVTVVVSANNQAVTNMIDSLGKVIDENESDILTRRWIPEIKSYGLYCPSGQAAQQEKNNKYQQAAPGDNNFPARNGFPGKIEDPEFIIQAETYYLEQCSKYAGEKIKTIRQAIGILHRELTVTVGTLQEEINKYEQYHQALTEKETLINKLMKKYGVETADNISEALKTIRSKYNKEKEQFKKEGEKIQIQYTETFNKVIKLSNINQEPKIGLIGRILRFFKIAHKKTSANNTLKEIQQYHEAELKAIQKKQNEITNEFNKLNEQIKILDLEIAEIEKLNNLCLKTKTDPFEVVDGRQDTLTRYKAFLLATHYWEGRWLLEVRNMQEQTNKRIYLSPEEKVKRKWQRYAMLTPVIVSTLYMAPRLFTAWYKEGENLYSEPLLGYVDLLIVDEAGQVPPELAAATFAIAKKAVVVGDVLQIEPIYNITRYVDQGNLIRHGLIKTREEYPIMQARGITASSGGSVMIVAQNGCPYWLENERGEKYPERGMFLKEHRRCLDNIISYCNRLAYNDRLIPMRGNQTKPRGMPIFSYLHIEGKSVKCGSSRKNEKEAVAILDWLIQNSDYLKQTYGENEKPLKELVAVLTPFNAQKKTLTMMVYTNKKYSQLRGITFGTVHALQGSEREVIIFSPVYTKEDGDPSEFFFNTDIRMLNVAVSRAREAFMVVGDMDIFKKSGGPAGLLAKYLFA